MNDQSKSFHFIELPEQYLLLNKNISNEDLKNLYSKFDFKCFYMNDDKELDDHLYEFLMENKLFVFTRIHVISNHDNKLYDSILCFENYCLFIESSKINTFKQMIKSGDQHFIDLNSKDYNTNNIKNDISVVSMHFNDELNSNSFVKITFEPIMAYTIQRYFYPSSYFKDPSFFIFNQKSNEPIENDFTEFDSQKMLKKISDDKAKTKSPRTLIDFHEKDFIRLRKIYNNNYASFYLVMHIKSFNIFMMKTIFSKPNSHSISNEVEFNKEYSHRCLTPFYGFVKKGDSIIGFIYEFMSNGTLDNYFLTYKDNIDDTFSYMTMVRIAQAINYLHLNSLIHRDIKPRNILIDHNHIPYLSDFDTIRKIDESTSEVTVDIGSIHYASPEQYSEKMYSFPSDIYSFGQIIYFLFEKDDCLKNANFFNIIEKMKEFELPRETKIPKSIQTLFKKCISFEANDRPPINKVIDFLYDEANSFSFLKISFLKKILKNMSLSQIQQYLIEMYYLLFIDKEIDNNYIHNHEIELYQILNFIYNVDASSVIYSVGKFYYDGEIIQQDYAVAREYFDISAEMNNADAFFHIGKLYHYGQGVGQDYKKAKEYYEIAAQQNKPTAINNLGVLYFNGAGVEKDYKKAKEYFELVAQQNEPTAINNLGMLYFHGAGVEKDYEKAKEYFELADKYNYIVAKYNLGLIYQKGLCGKKDYPKARYYFENSISFPYSLYQLGKIYLYGRDVKQDYIKALNYFEKSAKLNYDKSLYKLGLFYKNGQCVDQDYNKAIKYFELAALHDNPKATYQIAILHFYGLVENHNLIKAKEYFEISSKNNLNSFYYLGLMYEKGIGIDRDLNKSIENYIECTKNKNTKYLSQCNIGSINVLVYNSFYYYANNAIGLIKITEKDKISKQLLEQISDDYIKEAGLNEFPFGQNSLGLYYQFFLNQTDRALHFFEKASNSNFSISMYNLGNIYEKVGKLEDAIKWYIKASDHENEEIIFRNQKIEDERLEISKSYITCYTNLNLSLHGQNSIDFILKAIFRPIFSLIFHSTCYSYTFSFKLKRVKESYVIDNLKEFIIGNPLFHYEKELPNDSNYSQNSFGWITYKPKQNGIFELNLLIEVDHQNTNSTSKNSIDLHKKIFLEKESLDEVKNKFLFDSNDHQQIGTPLNENLNVNYNEKVEDIFNFMNKQMKFELIKNDHHDHDKNIEIMKFKANKNKVERCLIYQSKLCEIIIKSFNENQQDFIEIIKEMKKELYKDPYKILFGRIGIYEPEDEIISDDVKIKTDIDKSFYEGIGDAF